jgi:hypothetical protein
MSANVKTHPVALALALVITAAKNAKSDATAAGQTKGKLIVRLREAATVADAEGWEGKRTAEAFKAMAKLEGIADGTAKPYAVALQGYVAALNDGESITTGYGTDGTKPMPAPTAREYAQYTAEERATRARLKALRSRIAAAVKRGSDEAQLAEVASQLETLWPEVDAKPAEPVVDLADFFGEEAEAA